MGTETAFEIVRLPREGQASLASRAFSSVLTHSLVCLRAEEKRDPSEWMSPVSFS